MALGAVLGHAHRIELAQLAGHDLIAILKHPRRPLRRIQKLDRLAQSLLFRIAIKPLGCRVPTDDAAFHVIGQDRFGRGGHEGGKGFRLHMGTFDIVMRHTARRDIAVLQQQAGRALDRQAVGVELKPAPHPRPIAGVFPLKGSPGFQRLAQPLQNRFRLHHGTDGRRFADVKVIGPDVMRSGIAAILFAKQFPRHIDRDNLAGGVKNDHLIGHRLDQFIMAGVERDALGAFQHSPTIARIRHCLKLT